MALSAMILMAVVRPPVTLSATAPDQRETALYLRAYERFLLARIADAKAITSSARTLVATVSRTCPRIAKRPPLGPALGEFELEMHGALEATAAQIERPATVTFLDQIAKLRWRDRVANSLVKEVSEGLKAQIELTPPNICGDLSAWVGNGYHEPPATTQHFVAQVATVDTTRKMSRPQVLRRLRRYEPKLSAALAKRTQLLAHRAETLEESTHERAQITLEETVGLLPTPSTSVTSRGR
jgi:hypothetical protein